MAYVRSKPSNLRYPQGYPKSRLGNFGVVGKALEKVGKQTTRTGEQVQEIESRLEAIGRAVRGKTDIAPLPVGPTPEQLQKQQELEEERQGLLAKQTELAAKLEEAGARSEAERLQAKEELAVLQQQIAQQRLEQQEFQQRLLLQLQERDKGLPIVPILLGVAGLGAVILVILKR